MAEERSVDGVSLMPLLKGEGEIEKRALFWHFPIYLEGGNSESQDPIFRTRPGSAVRFGEWKLIEYFEEGEIELYNLREDVGEKNNLKNALPEKAEELHRMLISWRQKQGAPVPRELNPEYDRDYDLTLRQSLLKK